MSWVQFSWCCDRWSLSISILVSGTPLGSMTRFFFFPFFCLTIALLFFSVCPLWREDGSVICSAVCRWSESRRTHNNTLLSHLRLLGSLCVTSYDSQGLWWKYSNSNQVKSNQVILRPMVNRPVCLGVRHPFRTHDQVPLCPYKQCATPRRRSCILGYTLTGDLPGTNTCLECRM
jgi:hypothetical protein